MGKHTFQDVPQGVVQEALRRGEAYSTLNRPTSQPVRPYVTHEVPTDKMYPATTSTMEPPPADPNVWPDGEPVTQREWYEDEDQLDADVDSTNERQDEYDELEEDLGEPYTPWWKRRLVLLAVAHIFFFIPSLLFTGHLISTGFLSRDEPVVETEVKTVTETQMPNACGAAMSFAITGLDAARDYDTNELQKLPVGDDGWHNFAEDDGTHDMNHYTRLQNYHAALTDARMKFDAAYKSCLEMMNK